VRIYDIQAGRVKNEVDPCMISVEPFFQQDLSRSETGYPPSSYRVLGARGAAMIAAIRLIDSRFTCGVADPGRRGVREQLPVKRSLMKKRFFFENTTLAGTPDRDR